MNTFTLRALALSTAFVSFGLTSVSASSQEVSASYSEGTTPAHVIDCSQYSYEGYSDEDGNDKRDGVSSRALGRSPSENNARLCSGLPISIGDRRFHTSMQWNAITNTLVTHQVHRPIGHNRNTVTQIVYRTYPGSPTPVDHNALIANVVDMQNGNATLGQAAASILPSITNGMGAATINAMSNPCRNGGCNSGSTIVNMVDGAEAISMADANAAVAANLAQSLQSGGCGTGGCPTSPNPHAAGSAPNAGIVPGLNEPRSRECDRSGRCPLRLLAHQKEIYETPHFCRRRGTFDFGSFRSGSSTVGSVGSAARNYRTLYWRSLHERCHQLQPTAVEQQLVNIIQAGQANSWRVLRWYSIIT